MKKPMILRQHALRGRARLLCHVLLAAQVGLSACAVQAAPNVVVSIAPVHALVAAVMDGVGTPILLIPLGMSPHSYALRPSQRRLIDAAHLLIWVGASLEPFLLKPIAERVGSATVIELLAQHSVHQPALPADDLPKSHADNADGVNAVPLVPHDQAAGQSTGKSPAASFAHQHGLDARDPHVWLDPRNAIAIVTLVTHALLEQDPSSARAYKDNARQIIEQIGATDRQISKLLTDVRDVPYVVFHNAFTGFEQHYGLNRVAAIASASARLPGTRRVQAIRRVLEHAGVRCVFSEPQQQPRLLEALTEGLAIRRGVLDPLGSATVHSGNGWVYLMQRLAADLHVCLASP